MTKYKIIYDTTETVNQIFEVEAEFSQDAWEAFYQEIETEVEVTSKHMIEG